MMNIQPSIFFVIFFGLIALNSYLGWLLLDFL